MSNLTLYHGDYLEVMPTLEQGNVDMVFADLPYGVTENYWDERLAEQPLWSALRATSKRDAAMVLTATQPMASALVISNLKSFRYDLQWLKGTATGFLNAKKMPLRSHETILVFYDKLPTYNPQMTVAKKDRGATARISQTHSGNYGLGGTRKPWVETGKRYPLSYLQLQSEPRQKSVHPTQKPVALLEWLISTYTNPGDTVLDPVMGSGTTGVACANLGRKFIGIEKDTTYFAAAKARIEKAYADAANGPQQGALAV